MECIQKSVGNLEPFLADALPDSIKPAFFGFVRFDFERPRDGIGFEIRFDLKAVVLDLLLEGIDLAPKKRGGAFWLFGFMALGGFEVQRGFISKGRV